MGEVSSRIKQYMHANVAVCVVQQGMHGSIVMEMDTRTWFVNAWGFKKRHSSVVYSQTQGWCLMVVYHSEQ